MELKLCGIVYGSTLQIPLIVPYGIETPCGCEAFAGMTSFNCTLWN